MAPSPDVAPATVLDVMVVRTRFHLGLPARGRHQHPTPVTTVAGTMALGACAVK